MAIPVLCVGMAGCGAEQAAQDVKEAVDPVAEAAEKTVASGGARLAGDVTMRLPEGELPMVLSGAASFEEDRVAIELDFPGRIPGLSQARNDRAREEAGFPLRQVSDGDGHRGRVRDRDHVLDLLDVGEPVDVALPDENQVYDVTDEAADQVDGAQGDES